MSDIPPPENRRTVSIKPDLSCLSDPRRGGAGESIGGE